MFILLNHLQNAEESAEGHIPDSPKGEKAYE